MLRKALGTSINGLWIIIYAIVLLFLFIWGNNSILCCLLMAVLLIGLCFIIKDDENRRRIMIMCAVFFLLQLFLAFNIYFRAGWDVHTLTTGAWNDVLDPPLPYELVHAYDYLNFNQNNILLYGYYTLMAALCQALKRGPNFYYALMILVNIFIYTFTSFFLYENIRKLTDERYAKIAWFIYALLIGTSGWYIVPYSDSLTLFIPSLCLYVYLYLRSGYRYLLISFLTALGFYIKPQTGIFMIALIMILSVYDLRWETLKKNALLLFLSAVCALTVIVPVEYVKHSYFEPDKALGFTHFAMMGLNYETAGSYSLKDVEYSQQFATAKERTQGNIERIKERLHTVDLQKHFRNKLIFNFNDGNFYFGQEGYFYSYRSKDLLVTSAFLKDVFLDDGKYYRITAASRHLLYVAVLFLSVFSLKDKRKEVLLIKLSLVGLFMFQMIFEARSRYLFIYVPFFIVLAALGMNRIKDMAESLRKKTAS